VTPNPPAAPAASPGWPDPAPLEARSSGLVRWVGPVFSIAIVVVVIASLRVLKWEAIVGVVPTSWTFWLVFAAYYILPVASDWAIFRYLWRVPASGFVALLRKQVSNELLLGYLGELYFYTWARKKLKMTTSPFGAVKDVAILSALAGNVVTLAMIALAFPFVSEMQFDMVSKKLHVSELMLAVSIAIVVALPMLAVFFGKRLFSLTRTQLWVVTAIHFVRIIVTMGLAALAWNLALPQVAFSWWIVLSTVRLLISRLPFVTQKDIVFAGIAVFMVGYDLEIAALIAFWAAIQFVAHLTFGIVLAIADFLNVEDRR